MSLGQEERGTFRRNVIVVAALHVVVLGGLWLFAIWRNEAHSGENVAWLDGGGAPAAGQDAQPTPTAEETPADDETPTPPPERMPTPAAEESAPPSQIVIPAASPLAVAPTPTPTPVETPKPTPTPTPKPSPSATPKPKPKPSVSPKPKPKPKPSTSPKKHSSPKPSPHKSPASDDQDDQDSTAKAAFKKATGHSTAGGEGEAGTTPGTGGGTHGGNGHAGGGDTEGDFGWYRSMMHDKFYGHWIQPTSIVTSTSKFSALVSIRVEKDGTISDVSLAQSSGNQVMDQSVMEAARSVTQVDPPPEGLLDGGHYDVQINFELK